MNVALMKWEGPETVAAALSAVNAWENFSAGMNVLLKPNCVMGGSPKISPRGITTSPDVVGAVIHLLREKGAGTIAIAEGSVALPSLKLDTAAAFQWSGIGALAAAENVPLVDLNKGPHRTFALSDGLNIEIAEAVFEADFIVNLPVLKTHNQTVATICLKNLKGCLSIDSKKACHMETDLDAAIAEFNRLIPCHLNVVDALTATEVGPTPTGREDQVRDLGLLIAGRDRLSCDVVGSFLLGHEAEKIGHMNHFAHLTGRRPDFSDIEIIGENPADFQLHLAYISEWAADLSRKYGISGLRMLPYGKQLCSACGFNLWAGLFAFCRAHQGAVLEDTEMVAGRDAAASGTAHHTVLLGKCAIENNRKCENAVKIPGCPPDPAKMAELMDKHLLGGRGPASG